MRMIFENLRLCTIVALAFALPLVGCDKGGDEPTPEPEATEFVLTIDEVTAFDVTFNITPPAATPTYTVKLFPDNKQLEVSDIELAAKMVTAEGFSTYEGKQTLTFGGLYGNSSYRLVYFAYDVENQKLLSNLYRSERITTPETEALFDIEVKNITGLSAELTITPPDNEMTYYYYVEEKYDYETHFGSTDMGVINNDFSYWEFMASMYEGVSWLDLVAMELKTGTQSEHTDNLYGSLEWNTEYFVYAYGLNAEGMVTHPMTKQFFTTKAPEASDMTFNAEVASLEWDAAKMGFVAHATVTPSTDERYYAVITNKDWYDWYFTENNKGRSDENYIMYQLVLNCPTSAVALSETFTGAGDVHNEDWQTGLRPQREYAVFVFGFSEDGATTGLSVFPFTTPARPAQE